MTVSASFHPEQAKLRRQNRDMIRAAVQTKGPCRCGESKRVALIRSRKSPIGDRVVLECPKWRWWNQLVHDARVTVLHY